jgi:CRP-like cAMP-binding protein
MAQVRSRAEERIRELARLRLEMAELSRLDARARWADRGYLTNGRPDKDRIIREFLTANAERAAAGMTHLAISAETGLTRAAVRRSLIRLRKAGEVTVGQGGERGLATGSSYEMVRS